MIPEIADVSSPNHVDVFLRGLASLLGKIVCTDGSLATVSLRRTDYVTTGYLFEIGTKVGKYPVWVGANGPRLFFITYIVITPDLAQERFKFCFGNAQKVGWDFNYESSLRSDFVSVWGTCMTDSNKAFCAPLAKAVVGDNRMAAVKMTDYGQFWATDIAMMTQSFVRVCERHSLSAPVGIEPAPL